MARSLDKNPAPEQQSPSRSAADGIRWNDPNRLIDAKVNVTDERVRHRYAPSSAGRPVDGRQSTPLFPRVYPFPSACDWASWY
ncbi:hypothetical protein Q1695_015395 [Nippostrongylus brasiliensis]|nr:hypothetical protein Q1695_015395 [Nippostrongylus brasiliensis]